MKLVVKQDNFAKVLGQVSRIASSKAGIPVLANVLIRTDDNRLIVAASNLEVAITSSISAQVSEQGAIAVPAKLLTEFVNSLPHTNINIETDETKIKLSADGYTSTINSINADSYPALPESNEENSLKISADKLKLAISNTAQFTSSDTTRPILTGVNFYADNGELIMASTDGYRLAEMKIDKTDVENLSIIIPSSTLMEVLHLIGDNKEVEIKYNDEQITFILGETIITSKLIDGKFIAYQQLIPTDTTYDIVVNKDDFIKVTKLASLFAYQTVGTIIMTSDKKDKILSVKSITSQLGENESKIEAEIVATGDEECSVSLNSKYLLDALNCSDGEKVHIKYNTNYSPILIQGDNKNYRHIVMPVKSN